MIPTKSTSYGTNPPASHREEQTIVSAQGREDSAQDSTGFFSGTVASIVLVLGFIPFSPYTPYAPGYYGPEEQVRLVEREPTDRSAFYIGIAVGIALVVFLFFLVTLP